MTVTKEEDAEIVVNAEPEMATAVGVEEKVGSGGGGKNNEPPIPAGHSRFYCSKCRSVSWMCDINHTMYLRICCCIVSLCLG